jgi:Sap, sulfolipid-1-addressing protein
MAIGFGAIVAFSPTKLAISILYLSGRVAPVARALAFLFGNTVVIGSVAVLAYLGGLALLGTTTTIPPTPSDWLDVLLGIILLAIAAYGLARPGAIGPATLGVGDSDLRPRLGRALVFGASYGFIAFGRAIVVAAGSSWIARAPIGVTGQIVLLTVMLVVAQMPLWLPIVMHVFAPTRIERIQGFADRGVQQIGGRTSAVVVGCVGGFLLLSGLRWLL